MNNSDKADVIETAIIAWCEHQKDVLVCGRIQQPIEFLANYAHQLRNGDVHRCAEYMMVNGCCAKCGENLRR